MVDKTPSRSKPEIGSVRTQTIVTNQDHVPVMTFTSIVLMRRNPDPDGAPHRRIAVGIRRVARGRTRTP